MSALSFRPETAQAPFTASYQLLAYYPVLQIYSLVETSNC